jgi:hypothetical protein
LQIYPNVVQDFDIEGDDDTLIVIGYNAGPEWGLSLDTTSTEPSDPPLPSPISGLTFGAATGDNRPSALRQASEFLIYMGTDLARINPRQTVEIYGEWVFQFLTWTAGSGGWQVGSVAFG